MISNPQEQLRESTLDKLVEQLCDQMQAGKLVELDSLVEQYPEMEDRLRVIYPMVQAMANWSGNDEGDLEVGLCSVGHHGTGNREIGDFQILRQIGRGGMGVVYEAQQLSIQRKVALKILPLAALVDPRALQRFKNEVTAIATLEHPHIVSVYSVGEDRGIHYFAMQLIHGQSLAAVIRELRFRSEQNQRLGAEAINQAVSDIEKQEQSSQYADGLKSQEVDKLDETMAQTVARGRSSTARNVGDQTYFRNVAELTHQAAEALQHAHDHGIVHRDVKPGNLLLDMHGGMFVTDFGLARIESGPGVTITGDVLGTLRYMSPEQVLANRVVVDHRTDVYSLGATLYELLTLQPVWSGDNKAELIRQISFEEPAAPRSLNPSIPTDLETIALKAISKNPNDRYDNVQELGDDLERYLANKPIVAKRPTVVQRISKWSRRNPTVVISAVIILLLSMIGLVASNVLILQQKRIADGKTAEAREQSDRAERSLDQALAAVERLLTRIADEALLNTPGADQLRKQLYEDALAISQSIIDNESEHPAAQRRAAAAHFSVGRINQQLGNLDAADDAYRESIELWNHWLEKFPDHVLARNSLARLAGLYQNRSALFMDRGDVPKASQQIRHATEIRERLIKLTNVEAEPKVYLDLALGYVNEGQLLRRTGEFTKALTLYRRGIDQLEMLVAEYENDADYRVWMAWAHGHISLGYRDVGKFAKAVHHLETSLSILDNWGSSATDQGWASGQLAQTLRELGHLLTRTKPEKAKLLMQRAVEDAEKLCQQFPDIPAYSQILGETVNGLAKVHEELGEFQRARSSFEKAVKLRRSMIETYGDKPEWLDQLAWSLKDLSSLLHSIGERVAADTAMFESVELREQLAKDFASIPDYRQALATSYESSALFLRRYREFDKAEKAARKAIPVLENLTADFPDNSVYVKSLADIHGLVGTIFLEDDQFAAAKKELIRGLSIAETLADNYPDAESYDEMMVRLRANLATCHCCLSDWKSAKQIFIETIDFMGGLIAKHPHEPVYQINCAGMHNNLGNVYKECGQFTLAEEQYRLALRIYESLLPKFPNSGQIKSKIAEGHYALACHYSVSGDPEQALDALDRAVQGGSQVVAETLPGDSDLDAIRQHERFKKILAELKNGEAAGDK